MTNTNLGNRARAIAKARGVKTAAKTVAGTLKAIRSNPPNREPAIMYARPHVSALSKIAHFAGSSRAMTMPELLTAQCQGNRDKARTLPVYEPLRLAVGAALGFEYRADLGSVANCYRGVAYESICAARRTGQAVLVTFGRTDMRSSSRGSWSGSCRAHRANWIAARDIYAALPRHKSYVWRADEHGPYISGRLVRDYHPTGAELHNLIASGNWSPILTLARRSAKKRRELERANASVLRTARADVRERVAKLRALVRKHHPVVSVSDSLAAGNCEAGTIAWARAHGIAGDEVCAADLLPHAGERRVAAAIMLAVRRAMH
jgi:hypothetical protein